MQTLHQIKTLDDLLFYLNSLHPKYIDFNLKRIKLLMKKLDNPEKNLPTTIHIAGTNGKGSTLAFAKTIAEEHGLKVNCYSSPHLVKFNERIILNGKEIETKLLFNLLKEVALKNNNQKITFFEITTATAFLAFSRVPSDLCIIETGLGGRLDATNIINKKNIVAITNIGYDHKEFLGNSLKKIVFEKCGILKKNIPVVIASQESRYIKKQILYHSKKKQSQILKLYTIPNKWKLGLAGEHQYNNAQIAVTILKNLYKNLKEQTIKTGLLNTRWPGRLQQLENGKIVKERRCLTLIDGAHNTNGAKVIKNYLNSKSIEKCIVIFGMMKNKDPNKFINIIKNNIFELFLVPIENQKNSFNPRVLQKKLIASDLKITPFKNIEIALKAVPSNTPILITGSLYLIGEVLSKN